MNEQVRVHGRISSVSRNGQFGVITLVEPHNGQRFAVLNGETRGRLALLDTQPSRKLVVGTPVVITELRKGIDAYLAAALLE